MCGLAGFVGSTYPELSKLKLQSIFMLERGKDSTGILINNDVTKGAYKSYKEDYSDPLKFFSNFYFTKQSQIKSNTVIIHNRARTRGIGSIENAHPFHYEKDGKNYYFAKNGTLNNEYELCQKYGLEKKDFEVDSKLLGHIIVHHGWDVLKQYKGSAACVLYCDAEPNTIYVFRGMSLEEGKLVEERPLFYYQDENGMYFSSTSHSLQCAHDIHESKIMSFEPNYLYKIVNGKIKSKKLYDRSTVVSKEVFVNTVAKRFDFSMNTNPTVYKSKNISTQDDEYSALKSEPNPVKYLSNKSAIYFWRGLYFRNGHIITGNFKLNNDGDIDEKRGVDFYFYKGLMVSGKTAFEELIKKDIIRKEKDIKDKIDDLFPYININHSVFFFKYAEKRKEYKLYAFKNSQEIVSASITFYPLFSRFKYCLDLIRNKYTRELKQEYIIREQMEKEEQKDNHPWVENNLFSENFNDSTITVRENYASRVRVLKKVIDREIEKVSYDNEDFKLLMCLKYLMYDEEHVENFYEMIEEELPSLL